MSMTWYGRYTQQRPETERVYVERTPVPDAVCDQCGSTDVRRYPVACHWGARMVTKCQSCFHILALDRPTPEDNWPPFRSVAYDWEPSLAERASREQADRNRAAKS